MKKLFYLCMILSCILCGCIPNNPIEPEEPEEVTLEVSATDLVFEATGGTQQFTATSNGDLTIANENGWCKMEISSEKGDRTVTLTADAYDGKEDRNTNLTVKAGDKTKVLAVTQKHKEAIIWSKDKFDVPQGGGDVAIEIKNDFDYQPTIPAEFQSWIKQAPESRVTTKKVTFTISANDSTDSRSGYIIFSGNSLSDTVRVFQAQKNRLILTATAYDIPAGGKEIFVELKTNMDYEVEIPGDAKTWIERITTRAVRTDRLTFRVAANDKEGSRTAKIAVKDKNSAFSDTLRFVQRARTEVYTGNVVWGSDRDLVEFQEAGYTKVHGDVIVSGNLKDLQYLKNSLVEIDGSLVLECSTLRALDGLQGLKKITGDFTINQGYIASFEGLENLASIGGSLNIIADNSSKASLSSSSLPALKSFKGLSGLKTIGGNFEVSAYYGLTALESFEGLENLQSIGGTFEVFDDYSSLNALKSFKGLGGLTRIGKDFEVSSLLALESFEGLENLQAIGGNFNVFGGEKFLIALKSFKGLSGLKTIGGNFEVSVSGGLTAFESFEGLENLQAIGGNFKVYASSYDSESLTALKSFKGLSGLTSIGGDFEVSSQDGKSLTALESFEGLENLQTIGGNFKVSASSYDSESLTALKSFKGLSGLTSIGGDFEVSSQDGKSLTALESFEGLENLQSIGGNFSLYNSYSLESFKGLENLQSIVGNFNVSGFRGTSFEGLENLQTIGGKKLTIKSCWSLNNINALGKVEALDEISITYCEKLYDFCVLKNVVQKMTGTFDVKNNGYNPTKEQILNEQCSFPAGW